MWFNGFMTVIDMALQALDEPRLRRHRDAIIMGAFREDVCFLGGAGVVFQSASLTHFQRRRLPGGFIPFVWPDAARRARKFFDRARREQARGRQASAFVQLGRAAHPLIDMACPVHAQGVAHTTDPFEWCVEAMGEELRRLPADAVHGTEVEELVNAMAAFAQGFAADKTTSPWGRVLRRVGRRQPVRAALAREQARALIPRAAGCTAALFRCFLSETKIQGESDPHPFAHLEMSPAGLRAWLAQLERFCERHGGPRHYRDMLELIARCRAPS
jgi:hypothetical protein